LISDDRSMICSVSDDNHSRLKICFLQKQQDSWRVTLFKKSLKNKALGIRLGITDKRLNGTSHIFNDHFLQTAPTEKVFNYLHQLHCIKWDKSLEMVIFMKTKMRFIFLNWLKVWLIISFIFFRNILLFTFWWLSFQLQLELYITGCFSQSLVLYPPLKM
jgi:hypothetical protein